VGHKTRAGKLKGHASGHRKFNHLIFRSLELLGFDGGQQCFHFLNARALICHRGFRIEMRHGDQTLFINGDRVVVDGIGLRISKKSI
jgi:hypothetical protein